MARALDAPVAGAAIVAEDVSKAYPPGRRLFGRARRADRAPVPALRHVSFEVQPGETVGLLGPNGAGKTTLLKIVATLLYASGGRVLVHGCDVSRDPRRAHGMTGLVTSDERSFYWRLTGRQNLAFFAALYGIPPRERRRRVEELLEAIGLSDAADRSFHGYSSGMRQRLAIARGLLSDPRVVLYDEPTRSLDPVSAANIRRWMAMRRRESPQTTHLIATNHLWEAEQLCDRVVIISRGAVVAQGTIQQIRDRWRRDKYVVHRVTYRGAPLDRGFAAFADTGLLSIEEEAVDAGWRRVRVSALEDSDALSAVLAAILRPGGSVLRCETEQVPFDEVFCALIEEDARALAEAGAAS